MTLPRKRGLAALPLAAFALLLLFLAGPLEAQDPPRPPEPEPADTLDVRTDTLEVAADTLLDETLPPPRHLHELPRPVPAGMATGVWEWDREALLAVRAFTITDFLAEIPGVVRHRAGDFGFPSAVSAFGTGGGRVRVFLDGFEIPPLEGGTVDLSRVGMGTLERIRVERHPGELRIELFSLTVDDARPYTFIHV
ncbi:MAG: Plug domain-containing protein, partial [Gemmatimonadota bacterium]